MRETTYRLEVADAARGGPTEIRIAASIGIASFPSKDITGPDLLVKFADEVLYQAKSEGRGIIRLHQRE